MKLLSLVFPLVFAAACSGTPPGPQGKGYSVSGQDP
jgi:hypothetical protein